MRPPAVDNQELTPVLPEMTWNPSVVTPTVYSVIPGPERCEGARNPVITDRGYWIPGSPLRGAPE
jgi:hypothetical protein